MGQVRDGGGALVTCCLEAVDTGVCWVWGLDPAYYAGLGCSGL